MLPSYDLYSFYSIRCVQVVLLLLIMLAWWEMMVGVHLLREHWPLVRAGT